MSLRGGAFSGGVAAALVVSGWAGSAEAIKRRFEPTDLELEEPGTAQIDAQLGFVQSDGPGRLVVPDAEIDVGLSSNVELDVDFTFGVEGPPTGKFRLDHTTTDNTWLAAKLGLYDAVEPVTGYAWAVGLQLGPKLPLSRDAHGIGYEALLLVGRNMKSLRLGLNAGALADPGPEIARGRPLGGVLGLDVEWDVTGDFAVLGELGAVYYFSGDPNELAATLGLQYSPTDDMDLSVIGLVGLPPGSDRYGVLVGLARRFHLWR
ncbi:MAG: hypothetical protein U0441_12115 [Polyangiaceae bacterium]